MYHGNGINSSASYNTDLASMIGSNSISKMYSKAKDLVKSELDGFDVTQNGKASSFGARKDGYKQQVGGMPLGYFFKVAQEKAKE